MEAVRETICTSCVHLNVCKYKSELLETVKRLDNIIPIDNGRFFYVLNCKDYSVKPYSTIRYSNSTSSTNAKHLTVNDYDTEECQNSIYSKLGDKNIDIF